jgi:hypothetical protein
MQRHTGSHLDRVPAKLDPAKAPKIDGSTQDVAEPTAADAEPCPTCGDMKD